jgi:hypothetical protein
MIQAFEIRFASLSNTGDLKDSFSEVVHSILFRFHWHILVSSPFFSASVS